MIWIVLLRTSVVKLTNESMQLWSSLEKVTSLGFLLFIWRVESYRPPVSYYQTWKQTKLHVFPTNLPLLPPESRKVKNRWQTLTPKGSNFFDAFLIKLAIETNHIENNFLLTEAVRYLSVDFIYSVSSLPPFPSQLKT